MRNLEKFAAFGMIKNSDSNILSSVASNIKEYVSSKFNKDKPIASIVGFMGSGLLFSMGFKWTAVLYELADALGMDWLSFWSDVGERVSSFLRLNRKPEDAELTRTINEIVSSSLKENFSGKPDMKKIKDIAMKSNLGSEANMSLNIVKIAMIKNAGIGGKLLGFFTKTISFALKSALVSLGFVSAAGAIKGDIKAPSKDKEPIYNLKVSQNVPADFFTAHRNDLSSVWIEHEDIANIDNILLDWILKTYPQLERIKSNIKDSPPFIDMSNKFKNRNKLAAGLGILSIPKPYEKKIEIVSAIVNSFLHEYQ